VLMFNVGVLEPRRRMYIAHIVAILNPAVIKTQYWEYDFPAFLDDLCASTFITVFASLPSNPSTDTTKDVNCRH
jgi:hypothetical protein